MDKAAASSCSENGAANEHVTIDVARLRLWFPALLRDIADRFGNATALNLAKQLGGHSVALHREATPDHPIAEAVGMDVLRFIMQRNPDAYSVPIPNAGTARRQLLMAHIALLKQQGHSTEQIAKMLGIHARAAYRCVAAIKLAQRERLRRRGNVTNPNRKTP